MASSYSFYANDERDTERLGHALTGLLCDGGVVALNGTLGAGKTRLVQAIAVSAGVDRRDVVSPTFVLVHEYGGRLPILHLDAYRLRDEEEFLQLGTDEFFRTPNLVLIEWAERVAGALPAERLEVTIHVIDGQRRRFEILGRGMKYTALVDQLAERLPGSGF